MQIESIAAGDSVKPGGGGKDVELQGAGNFRYVLDAVPLRDM